MDRRAFLTSLAAAGLSPLAGCSRPAQQHLPPGRLSGASADWGHALREPDKLPPPSETLRIPVAIVGGGIGGLSAAWKLAKSGCKDFLLFELEAEPGGNARAGRNAVSEYPLSAHYLPLPAPEARAVRELLAELGVLEGDPFARRPRYDERYLCAVPQERLYRNGWWEDGLLPHVGVAAAERAQYRRFYALMAAFRQRRDDGRPAFALPMENSSRASDLLALDRLTMRDWLRAQGFDSPHLHWYVDYACRDDYGTGSGETSAWAGIHYFACRSGEAQDAAGDTVLTSPGGNAWLARGLADSIRTHAGEQVMTGTLAWRVQEAGEHIAIDLWQPTAQRSVRVLAGHLIWAAPLFIVPYVFSGHERLANAARRFTAVPWLIANLTLSHAPEDRAGVPLAWDNVLYDSPGLGYVVATHQMIRQWPQRTVWTYYRAVSGQAPSAGRTQLEAMSYAHGAEQVLSDLERAHPDIRQATEYIDIYRNAHAMVRPAPGLIWGPERRLFADSGKRTGERLHFAHADVSGFSLFEEAQYRGVLAAERVMRQLGRNFVSSLVPSARADSPASA